MGRYLFLLGWEYMIPSSGFVAPFRMGWVYLGEGKEAIGLVCVEALQHILHVYIYTPRLYIYTYIFKLKYIHTPIYTYTYIQIHTLVYAYI